MEDGESDVKGTINGNHEEQPLPEVTVAQKKNCIFPITIEPIVFFIFLTDTLADSVTPNLILMRTCETHFHYNSTVCSLLAHPENISRLEEEIQKYSIVILTGMNFLSKFFPAFLSLFLGPWSDYNGRKLMLIVPCIGYSVYFTLLLMLSVFPKLGPEYGIVFVLPVSLTGGLTNFIMGSYAYISDISELDNRSFRISLLESVMYSSVYIALLSSSYFLRAGGTHGFVLIFGICLLLLFSATIFSCFTVPESVPTTERGRGVWKIFDIQLIKEMFQVCFKRRENSIRAVIFLVIISLTLTIGISVAESNVYYMYTKLRFGWDIQEFTLWSSVLLLSSFIGLLVGSAIFTKCLKVPDAIIGVISYVFKAIAVFFIAFIPSNDKTLMFYTSLFFLFGGLSGPTGRAILSKSVPQEELGKIFAFLGATEAIFPLAIGPLYTILYNYTISTFPNAFLFVSGSIFALCSVLFIITYYLQKRVSPEFERLHNEIEGE